MKNFENPEKKGQMRLPMLTIERTGYTRSGDRLNSLHNEVKYEITSKNRNYQLLTPVPIDISYTVNVIAKYPEDIDKIASNFLVMFNNDIYVTCEHPKYEGVMMNNQIIMADSVSEEHPSELDPTQDDFIIASFQFTFKTYLFGGTQKAKKIKALSTYLSTVVSSYTVDVDNDDLEEFLKDHPDATFTATLTDNVDITLTAYGDSTDGNYFDNGIPPITKIDVGFYTVPQSADFDAYMTSVDNEELVKHLHYYPRAYISSESYSYQMSTYIDSTGEPHQIYTALSTENDYYESVDNYCTLAPYVDGLIWEINGASTNDFSQNVIIKPHM